MVSKNSSRCFNSIFIRKNVYHGVFERKYDVWNIFIMLQYLFLQLSFCWFYIYIYIHELVYTNSREFFFNCFANTYFQKWLSWWLFESTNCCKWPQFRLKSMLWPIFKGSEPKHVVCRKISCFSKFLTCT